MSKIIELRLDEMKRFGLVEAAVITKLRFWLFGGEETPRSRTPVTRNECEDSKDGREWVWVSYEFLAGSLGVSPGQIRRAIKKIIDLGAIEASANKDHSKWYSFRDDAILWMPGDPADAQYLPPNVFPIEQDLRQGGPR